MKTTKRQRVTKRRSRRDTNGDTGGRENRHGEAADTSPESFSAALAMIASLPLSDAEKADAVRRLMAERDGSKQ